MRLPVSSEGASKALAPVLVGTRPPRSDRSAARAGTSSFRRHDIRFEDCRAPLRPSAPLRSLDRPGVAGRRSVPRLSRVFFPTARSVTGSDFPRDCLPRVSLRLQGLNPPDALFLPKPLPSCFRQAALLGLYSSKVSPSAAWPPTSRSGLPAWRWLNRRRRDPSRGSSLASRALISAEVRCRAKAEAPVPPVPPLSFYPLQGSNAPATDPVIPAPPPLGLVPSRSASRLLVTLPSEF
jgi:hypothetical protein